MLLFILSIKIITFEAQETYKVNFCTKQKNPIYALFSK